MEVLIHQILCGEDEKGGYGLIKHTLSDKMLAKKIAFNSDIQDQAGNTYWEPSIRGFMVEDYFLFMKTFPDKSPEVRPGRVFSHVLVIQKKDLIHLANINPILGLLPIQINKENLVESIQYQTLIENRNQISLAFQKRFNKAIHGYANRQIYSNNIVWVGTEDYELAVSKYWQILSLAEKEKLNFGIYFNADSVPKEKLNFINIPENIESKFVKKGVCLIRKNDEHVLTEIFEQLLADDPTAHQRISLFQEATETGTLSREAINNVGKVLDTFENIDSINDLKRINTLSHVIAEYSPLKEQGVHFKEILLDKICCLVSSCEISEFHLIKTFKTISFDNSERKLKQSICKWLDGFLFSEKETKIKNFLPLFEKLNGTINDNWWSIEIKNKLNIFLSAITVNKPSVVFNWLRNDISILNFIEPLIDKSSASEDYFTAQLQKSYQKSQVKNLVSFALNRNWLKFHAKLMALEYPFKEALTMQLIVDKHDEYIDGINVIIDNISQKLIIEFTIENYDKRLIKIIGKYCTKEPSLLANIDVTNSIWQEIWQNAIVRGNNLNDGILEIQEKVYKLLDNIIEGGVCNSDLMEMIGKSEYGNILYYPNRERIWRFLPTHLKTSFLENTSTKLLQKISYDTTTIIPEDKDLGDFIISKGISTFLYYNRNNFKSTLPIFNAFKQLPEHILRDYVNNFSGFVDIVDATQLGKLTSQRNYKMVAHSIYQKSYSNTQFRVSLKECYGLLDFIDKGFAWAKGLISNVEIMEGEWWDTFSGLCTRLYPGGPKDSKIWERAGGDESELLTHSSGKETWLAALRKLRNGGCDDITPKKLIKKMLEEYKKNEELKTLKDLLERL